jgi:GT2 family glycosyltransferase
MKYAMNRGGYDYLHLLDNDVVVAPDAIAQLVRVMDADSSIGAAGSKICFMDEPDIIQDIGAFVVFKNGFIEAKGNMGGRKDNRLMAKNYIVDYAAACSLMIRKDVVKEVGIMDEGYFLYWDDMDWCARVRQKGYKIIGTGKSKVLHKMGAKNRSANLQTYYFMRNSLYYFNKYCKDNIRAKVLKTTIGYYYEAIYACRFYHKRNTAITFLRALIDALKGNRGKATIKHFTTVEKNKKFPVEEFINNDKKILMFKNHHYRGVYYTFKRKYPSVKITLINKIPRDCRRYLFIPCFHVFDRKYKGKLLIDKGFYWMDRFTNILPATTEYEQRILDYSKNKAAFIENKLDVFDARLKNIKHANNGNLFSNNYSLLSGNNSRLEPIDVMPITSMRMKYTPNDLSSSVFSQNT